MRKGQPPVLPVTKGFMWTEDNTFADQDVAQGWKSVCEHYVGIDGGTACWADREYYCDNWKMSVSLWNLVPDDLDFDFNPVRDTSEQERANLIQQGSAAIVSVFQSGLISQKTALIELRKSGATYGMWDSITDDDIDKADDMTDAGMDEMGMGLTPPMTLSAERSEAEPASAAKQDAGETRDRAKRQARGEQGGEADEQAGQAVPADSQDEPLEDAADGAGWTV